MESNKPQDPSSPPPKKRSWVTEAAIGGAMGSLVGLITSAFNKKMSRSQQVTLGAVLGAALGAAQNMLASDPTPPTPPVTPPAPPITPTTAGDLKLGSVPPLLELLVERGQLTPQQQASVLRSMKAGSIGFSGEIAVANGFITHAQLEHALADQSLRKAEAAIADIQTLTAITDQQLGAIAAPAYLRANWGNNGINPSNPNTSCTYGASAAANNAQNLVMVAFSDTSKNPALMPIIRDGVIAAANLTRGIIQGDSAQVPLAKMSKTWRNTMNNALRAAAAANPQLIVDNQGAPADINAFIAARDAEIATAVQQALATGQGCKESLGRG